MFSYLWLKWSRDRDARKANIVRVPSEDGDGAQDLAFPYEFAEANAKLRDELCRCTNIADVLQKIGRSELLSQRQNCTALDVAKAICTMLSETVLQSDEETEKLTDWEQEIRDLICKVIGEHVWEYDQCGYWGHQYCVSCHNPKYPELMKLRCSEAVAKIGCIREEDYTDELRATTQTSVLSGDGDE